MPSKAGAAGPTTPGPALAQRQAAQVATRKCNAHTPEYWNRVALVLMSPSMMRGVRSMSAPLALVLLPPSAASARRGSRESRGEGVAAGSGVSSSARPATEERGGTRCGTARSRGGGAAGAALPHCWAARARAPCPPPHPALDEIRMHMREPAGPAGPRPAPCGRRLRQERGPGAGHYTGRGAQDRTGGR